MSWLTPLFAVIQGIIDRMPSRKEALLNEIQSVKDEIKKLQQKQTPWMVTDSGKYYTLLDRLQSLELRASNLG